MFYDRHARSVLAYFARRTRDPESAADLTAETFAAAIVSRRRFRPGPEPASAWLSASRTTSWPTSSGEGAPRIGRCVA
jgi:DNA-directed RNA polymerase specialized sigma24 family protein